MSAAFTANVISRLAKIGIEEPWELIHNLPVNYDDFTAPFKSLSAVKKLPHGTSFYAKLILKSVKTSHDIKKEKETRGEPTASGGADYVKIELTDGLATTSSIVFGRVEPWLHLKQSSTGKVVHVFGKVAIKGDFTNFGNLQIVPPEDRDRIVARYRGKEKVIAPSKVADLTKIALIHDVDQAVEEILEALNQDEAGIISTCRLPFYSLKQLLMTLHLPKTPDDLDKAMKAARRLCAYYGIRKALEATERKPSPESVIPLNVELIKELVGRHPFTPTNDQRRAIWDIIQDMAGERPMDRLLSADVGNGKTLAYGIPAAYACKQGRNAVILLPTEPLAGQVADNIRSWYPDIRIHLATSGFNGDVQQGDMLIGTTAVLTWLKNHPEWRVDFAVTDEQQKMGTAQREALSDLNTNVLEATATPIPRTMAQTMFGSKKVSLIKDCPVQKTISTTLLGNTLDEKRQVMKNLSEWVNKGYRIAVIYPLVAEQQAYFYHIKADSKKEAEKIAGLMKKASVTVKCVVAVEESGQLLNELDNTADEGFIAEIHGEEQAHARLQKRFDRYMSEHASSLRYLGSRIDDEMSQKNKTTIMNAAEKWEKMRPGRVAVIHGRSKRSEKAEIIKHINSGGADILIATTLVEIGVDVKDLKALATIGAENLGAFTLHQLRGRVARNGGEGDFMMMTGCPLEELDPNARERLDLLVKYTSGDDIAMYDMEQRGFGNLSAGGKAQKGFEDGLFPSIKLSPAELDHFLRELSQDMKNANQSPNGVTL
jgi:RecG-like helicase